MMKEAACRCTRKCLMYLGRFGSPLWTLDTENVYRVSSYIESWLMARRLPPVARNFDRARNHQDIRYHMRRTDKFEKKVIAFI